jgi:hypothetical protein
LPVGRDGDYLGDHGPCHGLGAQSEIAVAAAPAGGDREGRRSGFRQADADLDLVAMVRGLAMSCPESSSAKAQGRGDRELADTWATRSICRTFSLLPSTGIDDLFENFHYLPDTAYGAAGYVTD